MFEIKWKEKYERAVRTVESLCEYTSSQLDEHRNDQAAVCFYVARLTTLVEVLVDLKRIENEG